MTEPKDVVSARGVRPRAANVYVRYNAITLRKQVVQALKDANVSPGTYEASVAAVRVEAVPHGIKIHVTFTAGDNK